MNIFQRWKQTTLANKGLVFSSILMALGTLFYAGAAIVQVCIMKQTARDASIQTEKLIKAAQIEADAASKNAVAAESFSASADGINQQTALAVKEFHEMAQSSQDAITQAKNNAIASISTSADIARHDQRAWFGLDGVPQTDAEEINNGIGYNIRSVKIFLKNTGKSPALQVGGQAVMLMRSWNDDNIPDYDEVLKESKMAQILVAQGQVYAPQSGDWFTVTTGVKYDRITDGDGIPRTIYVVGEFLYTDIFKEPHRTKYCVRRRAYEKAFSICPDKNWMD